MEMSVPCLVTVSLQSYKHQTGTNVPHSSNSPGKLTDLLFLQQKGPAMQKSLIISYQGTDLPALRSDGTRALWSPGGGAGTSPSACPRLPAPAWGDGMGDPSKRFQAFLLLFC